MENNKYESLLEAFRDLNSVSDDEVLTPKIKKRLVNEGSSFSLSNWSKDLEEAEEFKSDANNEEEIEVIDASAESMEQVKDKKAYIGQTILQCIKCFGKKFTDTAEVIASEDDPELFNIEDECPNCHSEGTGFEVIGQVGKVVPEAEEVVDAEEEVAFDNDEEVSDEPKFENEPEEDEEEVEDKVEDDEDDEEDFDEDDYIYKDEETDGLKTDAREDEDEDDDLELPKLGDKFDSDNVRPDTTSDDIEDEEVEEEEEEVEEEKVVKPIRRKLRLPAHESMGRKLKFTKTEELLDKILLIESVKKVIVKNNKRNLYEGLIDDMPAELKDSDMEGFNVGNGHLTLNVDATEEAVSVPLFKILNGFDDDETSKISVLDVETSEELFYGSKEDAIKIFGNYQFISLSAPTVLCLTVKGDNIPNSNNPEVTDSAEDALIDKVFAENDFVKHNVGDVQSQEYWLSESIKNKDDLEFTFNRYVKGSAKELVEEFKAVTGYKDELDKMCEKHGVKVVKIKEAAADFIQPPLDWHEDEDEEDELDENFKSFKNRKDLSEAVEKIKKTNAHYTIRRSIKEGYRYDMLYENIEDGDVNDETFDNAEYIKRAEQFAKQIVNFDLAKCRELYFTDYAFHKTPPADDAEEIIADALLDRIATIRGDKKINEEFDDKNFEIDEDKDEDETEDSKKLSLEESLISKEFLDTMVVNGELDAPTEIEEKFDENTGDDFKDKMGFLANDELEAIAGYKEVIEFFKEKGIDEDKIMDRLIELQEDEEEHLDELKELFKAVTGSDLVEMEEDEDDQDDQEEVEDIVDEDEEEVVDDEEDLDLIDEDVEAKDGNTFKFVAEVAVKINDTSCEDAEECGLEMIENVLEFNEELTHLKNYNIQKVESIPHKDGIDMYTIDVKITGTTDLSATDYNSYVKTYNQMLKAFGKEFLIDFKEVKEEVKVDSEPLAPLDEDNDEFVDFDTDTFDEDLNDYFNEAYADKVEYKTDRGTIDSSGNISLQGKIKSKVSEAHVMFKLIPTKPLTEALTKKALKKEIKKTTYKVMNNLSDETFSFSFTGKK